MFRFVFFRVLILENYMILKYSGGSRRVANPRRGCASLSLFAKFCDENCMKVKEFRPRGWRVLLAHPPGFASAVSIGGSRGGVRDARPPPGVQILSISCSFRENLACSRPPWRVHAPPRENPGSATGLCRTT